MLNINQSKSKIFASATNTLLASMIFTIGFGVLKVSFASTECGEPTYNESKDAALFVWRDCVGDGAWHIRVTGGGSPELVTFSGSVMSTGKMTMVNEINLDRWDIVDTRISKRINFRINVIRAGIDGFSFIPVNSRTICLNMTTATPIFFGSSRISVTSPLNINTIANCPTDKVKVHSSILGKSTRYIGVVEGDVDFNPAHFRDLGINTYRIYGGMSRWEATDDDGVYGLPTIAQIKNDPSIINWEWWDNIMTEPPQGSDYWWSGEPGKTWQGNARKIFRTLRRENIRPILTIRNVDNSWNPYWAWQLNPPRTDKDRNEWWEHVFATVFWLNVRNNYRVNDFEIHNEPDNSDQGWMGSQADYFELVRIAKDAIDHVYQTYLPEQQYFIHGPKTVTWSTWPLDALQHIPDNFNFINIHNYATDISAYVRRVHRWMKQTNHASAPLWLGEWGTFKGKYNNPSFALDLIKNVIRASQPGNDYVFGSTLFSIYDWGDALQGLIGPKNQKRLSYFAFRMAIRALQGGITTLDTSSTNPGFVTIASQNNSGEVYLLLVNSNPQLSVLIADFSDVVQHGNVDIWEFRADIRDKLVTRMNMTNGQIHGWVPNKAAVLIRVRQ